MPELRPNRPVLLATLSALLLTPGASAGTRDGRFAVEEAGRVTCARFLTAREENPPAFARYVGFIEGYMTAANRYEPNTFDLTPWHTPEAFTLILTQHCQKKPDEALAMVAQRLVVATMPTRLEDYSDMIEVGGGENSTRIYASILKRAQGELSRRGLYRGEADGQFTPDLRSAFQQFQRQASLDPTGLPDTATLWVLLNP